MPRALAAKVEQLGRDLAELLSEETVARLSAKADEAKERKMLHASPQEKLASMMPELSQMPVSGAEYDDAMEALPLVGGRDSAYDDGLAGIDPMESLPLRFDNPDLAMAMEVGDDEEDVYEHPLELKW